MYRPFFRHNNKNIIKMPKIGFLTFVAICLLLTSCLFKHNFMPENELLWMYSWNSNDSLFFSDSQGNDIDTIILKHLVIIEPKTWNIFNPQGIKSIQGEDNYKGFGTFLILHNGKQTNVGFLSYKILDKIFFNINSSYITDVDSVDQQLRNGRRMKIEIDNNENKNVPEYFVFQRDSAIVEYKIDGKNYTRL